MKFPVSMLRDFVETPLSDAEIGDLLTMAGFELEEIEEIEGDSVLDVKVMSNRGDGLSVFGLAREVLAKDRSAEPKELYRGSADRFDAARRQASGSSAVVTLETPSCPRYSCRLFTKIASKSTPEWIQKRLRQAGMRPISLLVDLTNYVMLEQGQPLHAFDYDKLAGNRIVVRQARAGERFTTLDGKEHELDAGAMMICDAEKSVGIAGVMGGLHSEVSDCTTSVLLESAHFTNTSIRATRKRLGISTEASYRFERFVDPDGTVAAIERFTQLFRSVEGAGVVEEEISDVYPSPIKREAIGLRMNRAELLLGMSVSEDDASRYLAALGFEVAGRSAGSQITVTPPSWRPDVVLEEDLIEELGRVHGYEQIPETLPRGSTTQGGSFGYEAWVDKLRESVVRLGYAQTISHSLRGPHPLDQQGTGRIGPRGISDPEMALLRNSVLPSLADAARRNGGTNLHLFEMGQVFGDSQETSRIGLLSQGRITPDSWNSESGCQASFFSLKGELERAFPLLEVLPSETSDPRLHPTRQATLSLGSSIGVMGQIHPEVAEESGLPADTLLAEIDLRKAYNQSSENTRAKPVSRNPAVRRDIAILVDRSLPYARIEHALASSGGDMLEKHWLFDVYEGKGIPDGKHSLAIALQFRAASRNLTDDEANSARDRVTQALAELGATLR